MILSTPAGKRLLGVALFAVAFGFVEASVVVYLRALYYPSGFEFPLNLMSFHHFWIELAREAATIVMLAAAGIIAGRERWEKFGYFLVAFGIWDIFYYVWLKLTIDWPAALDDWDVLFLIPLPWIGPVIAPVLIAALMTFTGSSIVMRRERNQHFRPGLRAWILSSIATAVLIASFVVDVNATLRGGMPQPYRYGIFALGLALYVIAWVLSCRPSPSGR